MKSVVEQFERFTEQWLRFLPILYIIATFEHSFTALHQYNAHLVVFGVDISTISNIMLVLGIDLPMYFAIQYIVYAQRLNLPIRTAVTILVTLGLVSAALNIHYMLIYSPGGYFADIVGVLVGALIPLMLVLFGLLRGIVHTHAPVPDRLVESVEQNSLSPREQLEQQILEIVQKHPDWSNRKIARKLKVSHTTVGRIRKKHNL